jgi:ABC-type multidrug transport system ATPase subunit/ABC-type multidrug transport system permease subunit
VSGTVFEGEITGLVGPDGAGKTTLIRIMAGLLVAEDGCLEVLGFDPTRHADRIHASIGYMPQRFGLYEDLSVVENLRLYADLRGLPVADRKPRFEELLSFTDLKRFSSRHAGKLSGGMKQKLGLACALIRKPRLLLLDEPSVGVDPISRRELWRIVSGLKSEGVGVVWSTSYLDEAEACDRVLLLNGGKLLFDGPPTSGVDPITRREFWTHINSLVEKGVAVMVTTHFMDEAEYRRRSIARGSQCSSGTRAIHPQREIHSADSGSAIVLPSSRFTACSSSCLPSLRRESGWPDDVDAAGRLRREGAARGAARSEESLHSRGATARPARGLHVCRHPGGQERRRSGAQPRRRSGWRRARSTHRRLSHVPHGRAGAPSVGAAGDTRPGACDRGHRCRAELFARSGRRSPGLRLASTPHVVARNWFNPNLTFRWFTLPGLIPIIAQLIGLIVTALSVARERELGTFDQLFVAPLRTHEILLGKVLPPLAFVFLHITLYVVVAVFGFGVPMRGSVLLLYGSAVFFLASVVGVGLFISALSATQQQAILGAFLFLAPATLLSGFATPIESTPSWLQPLTLVNPLRYFLVIARGIFLKGMGPGDVVNNTWPLLCIAAVTLTAAAWLFRRRIG